MPRMLPISKLQILAERCGVPLTLVAYRYRHGFPIEKLGVTEIVDGELVDGKFEWPGTEDPLKKPEKTGGSGFDYPRRAPVQPEQKTKVKITRRRRRLKN